MDFIGISNFDNRCGYEEQAKKVQEEANELLDEVCTPLRLNYTRIADKAADTVVAVSNLLFVLGISQEFANEAIERANRRNSARGRLGYAIKMDDGYLSNVNFGANGALTQITEDDKCALRFDSHENAQLMADCLYNLGAETVVVPYAAHP